MQKLTIQDTETKSLDITADNIAQLKALFPDAFTEGKVDFDVLKQLLGARIDERDEKYGLNWHGKRRARQLALMPSMGTLRPSPEDSVDWDTTQNLMIEGDNLEVLKLLQKSYSGKSISSTSTRPTTPAVTSSTMMTTRTTSRNYLELPAHRWREVANLPPTQRLRALPYRLAEHDVSAAQTRAESPSRRWSCLLSA